MSLERINSYQDSRFSQKVLNQHGCFLVDGEPYEVEIVSQREAVVRGREGAAYPSVIEEFRFYTPHISTFYDENGTVVREYPASRVFSIAMEDIQPSQFFADRNKLAAVADFLQEPEDIIIQVTKSDGRYISLDGHTRLCYAVMQGWDTVRAVEAETDGYIRDFVEEARRRGVFTPKDIRLFSHEAYREQWDGFCDAYFQRNK